MVRTTFEDLRSILPKRPLDLGEAIRMAELQAERLLSAHGVSNPPVPELVLSTFPRVQVVRATLAGAAVTSQWARGRWIVILNRTDAPTRQRFSLAHEFKHILDQPSSEVLYPSVLGGLARSISEQAADHFAASFLMPSRWLLDALTTGTDSCTRLAERFAVSAQAIQVRLSVLGFSPGAAPPRVLPRNSAKPHYRR